MEELEASTVNHTAESLRAIKQRITKGQKAVDRLVQANIGLVHDRANRYKLAYPSAPEYDDLVQEGMIGLMTAIRKYDPTLGNKFSTVAYYWIRQSIARGANKTGRTIRLPENRINDFTEMNNISREYEDQQMTTDQIDAIIMERLKLSRADLMNIRTAAITPPSLNRVVGGSDSSKELIDYVSNKHTLPSSEDNVIANEMSSVLKSAIKSLAPVKRDIVAAVFSMGDEPVNIEDVKAHYDISASRFRKLQAEAIRELKDALTRNGFSFSDFAVIS
jgi:RNA polymerase primary sigma factor